MSTLDLWKHWPVGKDNRNAGWLIFCGSKLSLQAAGSDSFGSRAGVAVTAVVKRENEQTGNSQDWEESNCTETPDSGSDFYHSTEGQFYDSDDSSFDWFEHVLITI